MSLNTTPRTWVTGEVVTAAEMNAEVRDALTGIQAAWTSYTPTLTNITLGTGGTVVAAWRQIGKTIEYRIVISLGTGGAFTGTAQATLPIAPVTAGRILQHANATTATPTDFVIFTMITGGSATVSWRALPATAGNAVATVNATVPFTWAASCILTATGCYETT